MLPDETGNLAKENECTRVSVKSGVVKGLYVIKGNPSIAHGRGQRCRTWDSSPLILASPHPTSWKGLCWHPPETGLRSRSAHANVPSDHPCRCPGTVCPGRSKEVWVASPDAPGCCAGRTTQSHRFHQWHQVTTRSRALGPWMNQGQETNNTFLTI